MGVLGRLFGEDQKWYVKFSKIPILCMATFTQLLAGCQSDGKEPYSCSMHPPHTRHGSCLHKLLELESRGKKPQGNVSHTAAKQHSPPKRSYLLNSSVRVELMAWSTLVMASWIEVATKLSPLRPTFVAFQPRGKNKQTKTEIKRGCILPASALKQTRQTFVLYS